MIQEKDASTPCDERHVKYRRNTNLLTQKNTGGKCIMGNQGTKHWKFSAFFVVSLMLIASLFSNAAMAAPDDGKGDVVVTWRTEAAVTLNAEAPFSRTPPLPAASAAAQLQFVYTQEADTNMNGGQLQIAIPRTWDVTNKDIKVDDARIPDPDAPADYDGSVIYITDADGDVIDDDDKTESSRAKGRVTLSMSAGRVVRIRVDLDGWEYIPAIADNRTLTITLGNVTAPARRADYAFQTSSKASGGRFVRLATDDDDDPDTADVNTDIVNVSNVASGVGSIAITKTGTSGALSSVFAGDTARITFTFTATGSMNAYGG